MPSFRPNLSAQKVDSCLRQALVELRQAEKNAVLWFADVLHRRLYRELGYSSMHQYAELALGFGKSKTSQFLRLSESLQELPALRRSVAKGELSWTKAREVAKVATRKNEKQWIQKARNVSSRELECTVKATRRRTLAAASPGRNQTTLVMSPESDMKASSSRPGLDATPVEELSPSTPLDVHIRMSAEQYARYQALLHSLQKHGGGDEGQRRRGPIDQTELLLAGLEQLALSEEEKTLSDSSPVRKTQAQAQAQAQAQTQAQAQNHSKKRAEFTRVNSRSPYQVIVHQCPDCGSGAAVTNRGEKKLSPQDLRAILCDAHLKLPGKKNRSPVPPRIRRAVLERDRYRCRAAGCGRTRFLAVHHLVPRERNGANRMENLVTLCSGCHRVLHAWKPGHSVEGIGSKTKEVLAAGPSC